MADFRTPLAAHRASFARIGPTFDLPAAAREALRRRFQAAERSGDPHRMRRDVGDVVGDCLWGWPWYDECVSHFMAEDVWPKAWARLNIVPGTLWQSVPHNPRVELVCRTLSAAAYSERDRAQTAELEIPSGRELLASGPDCPAEAIMVAAHGPRIAAGDESSLPPYFPGDGCRVQVVFSRRAKERGIRVIEPSAPQPQPSAASLFSSIFRRR